ncbi:larval cuticle protein A2B-like [Macrobrachium rosenbergii]|uniref:larval cuticle protein A2B-like n=1 Tax=Macrobrachium rosenbergii TaxID=79674 RepID=UPI0034D4232A
MNSKVLILLAMVSAAAADKPVQLYGPPEVQQPSPEYSSEESSEPASYNFEFAVEDGYSGADFNHQEEREEDNTQGSYSVQLPDGRRQTVTYYVDGDSGYIAEVAYEGEAQYLEPEEESEESSEPAPIYAAPEPKPRPTYSRPTYAPRKPSTTPKPRPTYKAASEESEEEEEETPNSVYGPPSRSYGAPQ